MDMPHEEVVDSQIDHPDEDPLRPCLVVGRRTQARHRIQWLWKTRLPANRISVQQENAITVVNSQRIWRGVILKERGDHRDQRRHHRMTEDTAVDHIAPAHTTIVVVEDLVAGCDLLAVVVVVGGEELHDKTQNTRKTQTTVVVDGGQWH